MYLQRIIIMVSTFVHAVSMHHIFVHEAMQGLKQFLLLQGGCPLACYITDFAIEMCSKPIKIKSLY